MLMYSGASLPGTL